MAPGGPEAPLAFSKASSVLMLTAQVAKGAEENATLTTPAFLP